MFRDGLLFIVLIVGVIAALFAAVLIIVPPKQEIDDHKAKQEQMRICHEVLKGGIFLDEYGYYKGCFYKQKD